MTLKIRVKYLVKRGGKWMKHRNPHQLEVTLSLSTYAVRDCVSNAVNESFSLRQLRPQDNIRSFVDVVQVSSTRIQLSCKNLVRTAVVVAVVGKPSPITAPP